ncbi:MAG: LuxR C-terminal-related transcriptional regulator [Clostridiales Family XIII bacterium]|nr:LuxR C-terminal-related transcriptional regulator [Clostridiales Family XIII bacterium]
MNIVDIGAIGVMPTGSCIMARPRVDTLLSDALEKSVTLVYAGEGCGKTYAVYSYLMGIDARISWVQLSESDNDPSRFWENICNSVSRTCRECATELSGMGFPGAGERYGRSYDKVLNMLKPNVRYVLVFDDVHLIKDPDVMSFMFALAENPLPGVAHVFISREETISPYDVNPSDDDFMIIDENDLLFTKIEVADYLSVLDIDITSALVDEVYTASEGLAHLVNLAGKLIKKRPDATKNIRSALRRNITKLIDENFFESSMEEMKKFFIKLSLLDHLSDNLVHSLPGGADMIENAMRKTSLIRYDTYMCSYHLHHLFIEFLRDKEGMLSDEERTETYRVAAEWCSENNYRLEAMGYYEKMGDYVSIIRIADSMQLDIDFHSGAYLLAILERAAPNVFEKNPDARVLYTRMLLSLGRIDDAIEKLEEFISAMESRKVSKADASILVWLYSNLGFARIIKATDTGEYDFADTFGKAAAYMKKSGAKSAPTTVNASIMPYACVVGSSRSGEPEKYIDEIKRAIPFTVHALGGCLYGSDDLTISEAAYYRGDMSSCERYAIQSCLKAREMGQSYIEGRALFLLLRMNLCRGRYPKIGEVLAQHEELVKKFKIYLQCMQHEVMLSWYYGSIGEMDNVAPWVRSDFLSAEPDAYITGLEDMAKLKYYLAEKRYHAMLAFLDRRPESHGIRKFLLGRIEMAAVEAVCLYNIKDRKGAIAALENAYEMSAPNAFDMPFIELGNSMRSLAGAALRGNDAGIPQDWLEQIRSKSATYAKRIAHVKSKYRQETGKDGDIQLTMKEREVLHDMSQGLSRTEIATYRGISVNTVKAMIQIIYEKLGADNSMDALRIAISKDMI